MTSKFNRLHTAAALAAVVLAVVGEGCVFSARRTADRIKPPVESILVPAFRCNDDLVAEAVRNVFIEVLIQHTNVSVVREGPADLQLEGTITLKEGSSAAAKSGPRATTGRYVAGITVVASRGSEVLTSASWRQTSWEGSVVLT